MEVSPELVYMLFSSVYPKRTTITELKLDIGCRQCPCMERPQGLVARYCPDDSRRSEESKAHGNQVVVDEESVSGC